MKKLTILLCLCLFISVAFCEENNGRDWDRLDSYHKTTYIIAFADAYCFCKETKDNDFPYGYNYGEIKDFTNDFYENPQYKIIPLSYALSYIIFPALKNSWSKEEIDKRALLVLKVVKDQIETTKEQRQQIGYAK